MTQPLSDAANDRSPQTHTLIGIFAEANGQQVMRYFTDEREARAFARSVRPHRSLAGVWAHMNWEEMEADLYRIRHSVPPTPPIDLDDL